MHEDFAGRVALALAGRDEFGFSPECRREFAAAIPHARLPMNQG